MAVVNRKYTGTIQYNANGGTNKPDNTVEYIWSTATTGYLYLYVRVTTAKPTRTGYQFVNWYDSTNKRYLDPNQRISFEFAAGGAQYKAYSLVAQWQILVTTPVITTQPSSQSLYRGDSTSLSISATTEYGTLSYQWQSSTDNVNFTNITGATSTTYTPDTDTVGTVYYRCIVTSSDSGESKSATSNTAVVTINATPTAQISVQPKSETILVGATHDVFVTATGGSLDYQWYESSDGTTFTRIPGALFDSYTIPTHTAGKAYYKCTITNTLNGYTATVDTAVATITLEDVTTPVFNTNPQDQVVYIGNAASPLTALATSNAPITYQWQTSSDGLTWTDISGATGTAYTPPSDTQGGTYYRCVATASAYTLKGAKGTIWFQYACLSTDTKPTAGIEFGSYLFEVDTGYAYQWDGNQWVYEFKIKGE